MQDNNSWSMPTLRSVAYVYADDLPAHLREQRKAGIMVPVMSMATEIKFFGVASLKCDRSKQGVYEDTLTFSTLDILPADRILAFVAEDMAARRWLIGAREAPHPSVRISGTSGESVSDGRRLTYTVNWKGCPALCAVRLDSNVYFPPT